MKVIAIMAALVAGALFAPAAAQADPYRGILLNQPELDATSSTAPFYLKAQADVAFQPFNGGWQQGYNDVDLANQDSTGDITTLAAALLYAKGLSSNSQTPAQLLAKVCGALNTVQTTGPNGLAPPTTRPDPSKPGGRALSIARGLPSYIYAYDLVNAPTNCNIPITTWATFLDKVTKTTPGDGGGYTVATCEDHRVNNWGGFCQQAMTAYHALVNGPVGLTHDYAVFRAYAGEPTFYGGTYTYASGDWGSLAYQADPSHPVGINRAGTTIAGNNVDGVLGEDQRRVTGSDCTAPPAYSADVFRFPLCRQNYTWEDMQSEVMVAYMLQRQGYNALNVASKAIKRVIDEHYRSDYRTDTGQGSTYPATGDDAWIIPLANKLYGTSYAPSGSVSQGGKAIIGADWWATASATDDSKVLPVAPNAMIQGATNDSVIYFQWEPPGRGPAIDHYEYRRVGAATQTVTGVNGAFGGLSCGNTYRMYLRSVDAAGNKSPEISQVFNVAPCGGTDHTNPPPPSWNGVTYDLNIFPLSGSDNPEVDWDNAYATGSPPSDVSYYVLSDSLRGGFAFADAETNPDADLNSYDTSNLRPCGETIRIWVQALDAAGNRSSPASRLFGPIACP